MSIVQGYKDSNKLYCIVLYCVSFDKRLTQPASSDPGELITACFLVDVSDPALCRVVQLVCPGASDPGELITECLPFHVSDPALCTGD